MPSFTYTCGRTTFISSNIEATDSFCSLLKFRDTLNAFSWAVVKAWHHLPLRSDLALIKICWRFTASAGLHIGCINISYLKSLFNLYLWYLSQGKSTPYSSLRVVRLLFEPFRGLRCEDLQQALRNNQGMLFDKCRQANSIREELRRPGKDGSPLGV